MESELGQGGQAKVFKAKFHGNDVAMKFIPLDHVKDGFEYEVTSYGCHEFFFQEKFFEDLSGNLRLDSLLFQYMRRLLLS